MELPVRPLYHWQRGFKDFPVMETKGQIREGKKEAVWSMGQHACWGLRRQLVCRRSVGTRCHQHAIHKAGWG